MLAAKIEGAMSYQNEPPVAAPGKSRKMPSPGETYLSVAASARVMLRCLFYGSAAHRNLHNSRSPSPPPRFSD
eukprot:COSAG02_NODE_42102_length_388_cov_0.397924_2_plen_72_part_01